MTALKERARISKEKLNKLCKGFRNELYIEKPIASSCCENCDMCKNGQKLSLDYCDEYCPNKNNETYYEEVHSITKRKEIYNKYTGELVKVIEMDYVLKNIDRIKPSKNLIKQYIFYHFLLSDRNKIRKNVSISFIANQLNIAQVTVKRNNSIMQDLGLISAVYTCKNRINIYIYDEDKLYLTKEEGGTGFLPVQLDEFENLMNKKNVNELRAEIKKMLRADASVNLNDYRNSSGEKEGSKNKSKKITDVRLSYIAEDMPFYLRRSKSKLMDIICSPNSWYGVTVKEDNKLEMNIRRYLSSDQFEHIFKKKTSRRIDNFLKLNNIELISDREAEFNEATQEVTYVMNDENIESKKERYQEALMDLSQLCIEYGTETIKSVLMLVKRRYIDAEGITIRNIGAFTRTIIMNHIQNEGSLFSIAV